MDAAAAVGHELQQLEVAGLEAVVHACPDLHHPDDLVAHQEGGGHERGHPLAQDRRRRRPGHVVDDDGLGP